MEQNQKRIKQLYRSTDNRIIFGVCGGLGEYFEIDPIIFRILFLILTLNGGLGLFIYILLAIILPKEHSASSGVQEESLSNLDLKKRADGLVSELRDRELSRSRNNWLGWIIVIFGSILLLNQILPKYFINWNLFWAVLLIIIGFYILNRGGMPVNKAVRGENLPKKEDEGEDYKKKFNIGRLFFGLLFLVLGSAFLARNLGWIPSFYADLDYLVKFWPVFIIVLGLSFLSRESKAAAMFSAIFVVIIIILLAILLFFPSRNLFLEFWNLVLR